MAHDEDPEDNAHAQARTPAPARAKEPKAGPYEDPIDKQARDAESVDDRVMAIAYLLTQGRWTKLKALQYAHLWAVSPKTVEGYAGDARRLCAQLKGAGGLKRLRVKVERQLDAAYELAMVQGDARAAVAAAKARADIAGLVVKKTASTDGQGKDLPAIPQVALQIFVDMARRTFEATHGRPPTPEEARALLNVAGEPTDG